MQILDDGRVTDSQGRVVNFNNTVLIMTSNIGSQYITAGLDAALGPAESVYEAMRDRVLDAARAHFRPEFINRVDEYIVFQQLAREQIEAIVRLQVRRGAPHCHHRPRHAPACGGGLPDLLAASPNKALSACRSGMSRSGRGAPVVC